MGKRKEQKINCTAEFTEGATERITQAFVDVYLMIRAGKLQCKLLEEKIAEEEAKKKKVETA